MIATFAPRPFETDPDVLRVPFFHRNIDYDEVIFYHRGEFFSRVGIDAGMLTFHPAGIHHGPQPGAGHAAPRNAGRADRTDEVAINIDARRPLHLSAAGAAASVAGYAESWQEPERETALMRWATFVAPGDEPRAAPGLVVDDSIRAPGAGDAI